MIYVFLAEGFEEIEALTPVDILRRGGVEVVTVGIGSQTIKGSHSITVTADITDNDITTYDSVEGVILPGGMPGTLHLEQNQTVIDMVDYCARHHLLIGAICAAPSILGHMGLLRGKTATAFPSFETELEGATLGDYTVRDDMIVTARGMGVSVEFALMLLSVLKGEEQAEKIRKSIQCR